MAKTNNIQKNEGDGENASNDIPSCFTIMSFGGWRDQYYEEVFKPAIEDAGMKPRRADDIFRPSTIVSDIWSNTKSAEIILADLSKKNANVMYELGLAHAIAKPAILVTEAIEDVPFDLRALRVIVFDKNAPNWGEILREKITRSIKEIRKKPLRSVPSAFLAVDESQRPTEVSPVELELLELRQQIEQLRRMTLSSRTQRRPRIEPDEAEAMLRMMVDNESSDDSIMSRLSTLGVPKGWIQEKIEEFREPQEEDEIPF